MTVNGSIHFSARLVIISYSSPSDLPGSQAEALSKQLDAARSSEHDAVGGRLAAEEVSRGLTAELAVARHHALLVEQAGRTRRREIEKLQKEVRRG